MDWQGVESGGLIASTWGSVGFCAKRRDSWSPSGSGDASLYCSGGAFPATRPSLWWLQALLLALYSAWACSETSDSKRCSWTGPTETADRACAPRAPNAPFGFAGLLRASGQACAQMSFENAGFD